MVARARASLHFARLTFRANCPIHFSNLQIHGVLPHLVKRANLFARRESTDYSQYAVILPGIHIPEAEIRRMKLS